MEDAGPAARYAELQLENSILIIMIDKRKTVFASQRRPFAILTKI